MDTNENERIPVTLELRRTEVAFLGEVLNYHATVLIKLAKEIEIALLLSTKMHKLVNGGGNLPTPEELNKRIDSIKADHLLIRHINRQFIEGVLNSDLGSEISTDTLDLLKIQVMEFDTKMAEGES